MNNDKVSIIIVTLNASKTIEDAIKSVINQDYDNKELIIIDGKSTDSTIDIINKYNNEIVYWISEPDKGIYDAMNKGIARASGRWILFLGSDDTLIKEALTNIFSSSYNYNLVKLIYSKVKIDNKTKTIGEETNYNKLIENNIPHQGIFYNKEIFQQYGSYNLRYKILSDYDLNLKIFRDNEIIKYYHNKIVSNYNSKGISNTFIDYHFFYDRLQYLTKEYGLSKYDYKLEKYYFFIGIGLILEKKLLPGFKNIFFSILISKRKIYYSCLFTAFLMGQLGLWNKYKFRLK